MESRAKTHLDTSPLEPIRNQTSIASPPHASESTMALTTDTDSVGSDVSPPLAIVPLMDCPLDSTVATIVGTNTGNPADTPPGTAIAIGHDTAHDPTNPPESNKSDHEDVLIDAQEEDTSPVQKKKDKDRELEKARLVEWASSLSLKDVVLTKDGLDVETLGVRK